MQNKIKEYNIESKKEFFLVFFFILLNGNPFIMQRSEISIFLIFAYIMIFFRNKFSIKNADVPTLLIIIYFISFEIIHRLIFELSNTLTIFRVTGYFLTAYFVFKVTNKSFMKYFLISIYYLSIISLVFYLLGVVSPGLYKTASLIATKLFPLRADLNNYFTPTLLFYTFAPGYITGETLYLRNPGFAWEAGGFATFLNIAFVFYLFGSKRESSFTMLKDKGMIVFIISLILTFSTAGYVTFAFILLIYNIRRISIGNSLVIISLLVVFFMLYQRLDFLSEKIEYQLSVAETTQNRFGSALLDWQNIKERPLFGWSRDIKVIFGTSVYESYVHRPNGLTNFIRSYGFIYVISFFTIMYYSLRKYFKAINITEYKLMTFSVIGVILMMGFTQQVVHTTFTMSLLFWGQFANKPKIVSLKIK